MQATDHLAEAERLMNVCNACRYCEGLCAVFPAMEMRRAFGEADLAYLANLCHGCGACYIDCQYSPPHEFDVNVPRVLAALRADTYRAFAWPSALGPLFDRNGLAVALLAATGVAGFIIGLALVHAPATLIAGGSFYRLVPHQALVAIFGAVTVYALVALAMGFRSFWRATEGMSPVPEGSSFAEALGDALSLRYLDGGGGGCYVAEKVPDLRRLFHHLTFYGFNLCFAATCTGTVYHYFLGMPAPYAWYQLPKLLGIVGGLALTVGTGGLFFARRGREPILVDTPRRGMDVAFILMLFLTSATGLLLALLRATPAMGILLAVHLGIVFSLILTMPYGKFVHGIYRFGALLRYAAERRVFVSAHDEPNSPGASVQ